MELEYVNKIYIDDLIDNKQNRATEKKTNKFITSRIVYYTQNK